MVQVSEMLGGKMRRIMKNVLAKGMLMAFLISPVACTVEPLNFSIDLSSSGKRITNKFSDINMWMIEEMLQITAEAYPANYFNTNFPFIERIQLMAATGGNEARDLFKNPTDYTTVTDYDFTKLIKACENIVAKGIKPMIKTGWVPLKLSANPNMSVAFQTNLRPPRDYDAYYAYIKAMAEALKTRFGIEQMKTWSWGVGVEYENKDWFEADDVKSESTKLAYFKLYDYAVAALADSQFLRASATTLSTFEPCPKGRTRGLVSYSIYGLQLANSRSPHGSGSARSNGLRRIMWQSLEMSREIEGQESSWLCATEIPFERYPCLGRKLSFLHPSVDLSPVEKHYATAHSLANKF